MRVVEAARIRLRQGRRGAAAWTGGLAAITTVYVASYPSIAASKAAVVAGYPVALKRALNLGDLSTPVGYLNATAFGIPLMLLSTVYVINAGTAAIAGEEDSKALEVLLAYPMSRTALVLSRMLAIVTVLTGFGGSIFLIIVVLRRPVQLPVSVGGLAAATITWLLLGTCLAGVAVMISAANGRRAATAGLCATAALLGYLAGSFLPLIPHLRWIRHLSPYAWFTTGDPLINGLQLGNCLLLVTVAVLSTALAVAALNYRDLHL